MDPVPRSLAGYAVSSAFGLFFIPESFEANKNCEMPESSSFSLHPSSTEPQMGPQQAHPCLGTEALKAQLLHIVTVVVCYSQAFYLENGWKLGSFPDPWRGDK